MTRTIAFTLVCALTCFVGAFASGIVEAKFTTQTPPGDECAHVNCTNECSTEAIYTRLENCSQVCECINGKVNLVTCNGELHFNLETSQCDFPENVQCDIPSDPNSECDESDKSCPAVDGKDPTYLPLPDCTKFCECSNGKPHLFDCPDGLHFNPVLNVCDWPENAGCENGTVTSVPPVTSEPETTTEVLTDGPDTLEPVTSTPIPPEDDPNAECEESEKQCPAVDGKDPTYLPLPDCTKFCECSNGNPHLFTCPDGLHFNPVLNVCDWPQDAGCENGSVTTLSPTPEEPETTTAVPTDEPDTPEPTTSNPIPPEDDPNAECEESQKQCPAVDGKDPTYLPLPDCTKFCECSNGNPHLFTCPDGLHFNPVLNVCDWPQDAGCANGTVTTVPPTPEEPETTTAVPTDEPDTPEPTTSNPIPPEDDPNAECEESEKQCPAVDGKDPTYLPLPDCTKFCECSNGNPHLFTCPDGLHFNPVLNVCDWPQDAGCANGTVTTVKPTTAEPITVKPTTAEPIPVKPTTEDPNAECQESVKQCPAVDGKDPTYLPLPDCTKFCECSNGNPHLFTCPDGLHFNPVLNVCDWPQNAGCENGPATTLKPTTAEPITIKPTTAEPTPVKPTTEDPNAECQDSVKQCPAVDGKDPTYLPLPDCTKFCECSNGNPHLFTCPDGLHFNPVLNVCDWPQDAGCENGTVTTAKPTTAAPITVKPTTAEPTPVKPTTVDPNAECQESVKQCPAVDGKDPTYLPLPDCTKFCECSNGNPHLFTCPDGLHFNPVLNVCDWPQNAGCENGPATTLKPTTAAPVTVKPTTAEPTPVKPTTEDPNAECQELVKQCPAVDGKDPTYLPLPDCTKFCECSNGNPHLFTCPDGLHFNPVLNVCDWPQNAGCENGPATTLKPTTAAPVTVKPTTAEPTPVKPTTEDPNAECQESVKQCPAVDGKDPTYLPLPDCTKFCECSNGNPHLFTCPDGLHFNPVLNVCDWPQDAGCANGTVTTAKPTTAAPITAKPTTAEPTPVKPTTEDPNAECQESVKQCPAVDGKDPTYLPLPDCTKFCECSNGNPHLFTCPDGLHFNPVLNVCDWPQDAGCANGTVTTAKPTTAAPITAKPTTAEPTPVKPTTEDPNAECQESVKQCPAVDGKDPTYLPLPDCTKFCECSNGNPHLFTCPDGLHFNPVLNVCDWPQDAGCANGTVTTAKPTTVAPITVKPTTAEPTPVKPTTEDPNAECQESVKQCPAVDGKDPTYLPLPDCTKFCECSNGNPHLFTCRDGLHFNPVLNVCDWPQDAGCENGTVTTAKPTTVAPPTVNPTTAKPTTAKPTTAKPTTTVDPNAECQESVKQCPAVDGKDPTYLPLPDCTKFCECSNGKPHLFDCPEGLHFNPVLNVCDWPQDAGCENGPATTLKPTTAKPTTAKPTTVKPTTAKPTTAKPTTAKPTTTTVDPNAECQESVKQCPAVDGKDPTYLPLPDCTKFCECSNGKPYLFDCPEGLHFNPVLNVCDWPQDAGCENGPATTLKPTTAKPTTAKPTTVKPTTAKPTTAKPTTAKPTTTTVDPNAECQQSVKQCPAVDGKDPTYLPLPDCTKFCECSNGKPYLLDCPAGLHFNPVLNVCDWPQDAGCENGPATTLKPTTAKPTTAKPTTAKPTTAKPTTAKPTTAKPTTVAPNDPNAVCLSSSKTCPAVDGAQPTYLPLPDCTKFCECSNGTPYAFDCPPGLHFNPVLNVCDWPQDAGCTGL